MPPPPRTPHPKLFIALAEGGSSFHLEYPFALLDQEICQGPNVAGDKVTLQPGLWGAAWPEPRGEGSRDPEVSMMTESGKGSTDPQGGAVGPKIG